MHLSVSAAIDDPEMLGGDFAGPSWDTWRAVMRAFEGLPLSPDQDAMFREVAGGRDPPSQRCRELWVAASRRAGKDSITSAIATIAALGDYRARLRTGERAVVLCMAVDRGQAKIIHSYILGYFRNVPMLQPLAITETGDTLSLNNGVDIIIATNSFRSVRGRTIACAILDEVSYWRSEESANPDVEVYNAIAPGLVTLNGLLIGISSPYRRSGLLYEKWRKHYGKNDPDILVVAGASRQFNPTIPQRVIDAAVERDPENAASEWLGQWRSDLEDFVSKDAVDACIVRDRRELPRAIGVNYQAFTDLSGGGADAMTLAVAHRDSDGRGVLDAIREIRPPCSTRAVVAEFAALLRHSYGLSKVKGDHYAGEWPRQEYREHGIEYQTSDKNKSDIYLEALPLINSGMVELLDHPKLINQITSLERRTGRGTGRDVIDHPARMHDDLANSALGALVLVTANPEFSIPPETMQMLRSSSFPRFRWSRPIRI